MTRPSTETQVELEVGYASGKSVPRKEDRRLVQGQGVFVDDVKRHGMGYVHFVRSPYAHAKIVSVDVSGAEALEGVYGTLAPRRGGRADRSVLRADDAARQPDQGLRARRRPRPPHRRAGRRRRRRDPRARPRRRRPRRGRVRAARRDRRRPSARRTGRSSTRTPARTSSGRARSTGATSTARSKAADKVVKIKELHFDRFSSTPLECSAALVEYERGTGQFTLHCNHQMPGVARDLDGAGAARAARQAPLRHQGHRRRVRQQDHDARVADRLLPARAEAEAADPVDGVAHRPAHRERARQRALVPRHRGRRPERRDDARLQGEGTRRLRRVPAVRAARLHHLGAGHARAATAGGTSASTSRRS